MRAEEDYVAYKNVHGEQIQQESSYRKASSLMGRQEGYLGDQAREGNLSIYDALHSLEVVGHPLPRETFHTAFCQLDTDPALILEAAREHQHLAPDLYFREIAPRLKMLVAAGPTPAANYRSRAKKIVELDELRRQDRHQAKEKLQRLISGLVERLEQTATRPPRAFGELAWALGVLAAVHRYAGRRSDAVDLLVAAYRLCLMADDFGDEGDWFVRAGLLLVDLCRNDRAHQFMLEAGSNFFLANAAAKQVEAEISRAYVLSHARLYSASIRVLERMLPLLTVEQVDLRCFAHQTLAKNFRELGNLAEASKHLSMAIGLIRDDLARASCLWTQANLLNRLGQVSKAIASYREALPFIAKASGAAELAEMSMEYAKLLVRERRRPELQSLAADLSGWVHQLRGTRKLRDIIDDFTALIEVNKLSEVHLQKIVERILASKSVPRKRTEIPTA